MWYHFDQVLLSFGFFRNIERRTSNESAKHYTTASIYLYLAYYYYYYWLEKEKGKCNVTKLVRYFRCFQL